MAAFQLNNKLQSTGDADPATLVLLLRQTRVANADAAKASSKKALERAGKDEDGTNDTSNETTNTTSNNTNNNNSQVPSAAQPGFTTPVKERPKDTYATPTAPSPIPSKNFSTPSTSIPSTPVATTPTSFPSTPLSPPSFGTPSRSRPHTTPAKSVLEQLYLRTPQHAPMWVYCAEIHENTTLVVINQGLVCFRFF